MNNVAACDECGRWPQPQLAVDGVVIRGTEVLLITRGIEPWKGELAFPGGFVEEGEDPEVAVIRELKEETGLEGQVIRIICVKGKPKRDPRGHVVSLAYLIDAKGEPQAGDDASSADWYPISEVKSMAGDHMEVLTVIANILIR